MIKHLWAGVCCAATFSATAAGLHLQSPHAIVVNRDTGATLYAKGEQAAAPIASVTKLVTAMVVIDQAPNMGEVLTVTDDDVDALKHSRSRLPVGSRLPRREMLRVALVSSENRAAHALARYSYGGDMNPFVRAMNAKAQALGMSEAHFVDPTGLSPQNQASAQDLARLVEGAAHYPAIHEFTSRTGGTLDVGGVAVPYKNTNHLVGKRGWNVFLSKTGFINEAGRCIVMGFRAAGHNLSVVLMGATTSQDRERDLLAVRSWISTSHERVAAISNRRRHLAIQRTKPDPKQSGKMPSTLAHRAAGKHGRSRSSA